MKPLKKFFMKRWPQSDKKEAPKKLATSGVCSKQHRSDTAQTMDDTCSMEESGGEQEAAPWRVGRFLRGVFSFFVCFGRFELNSDLS
jgi:hypothetical protein